MTTDHTTISRCPQCGQEMHPTDYYQQRESVAAAELQKLNAEWNERYQRMLETEENLTAELRGLRAHKASVDEALNMGDGSYRP